MSDVSWHLKFVFVQACRPGWYYSHAREEEIKERRFWTPSPHPHPHTQKTVFLLFLPCRPHGSQVTGSRSRVNVLAFIRVSCGRPNVIKSFCFVTFKSLAWSTFAKCRRSHSRRRAIGGGPQTSSPLVPVTMSCQPLRLTSRISRRRWLPLWRRRQIT
jgi:hypothetical protein